jgi:PHP family Zn ribbon phosphoesterase
MRTFKADLHIHTCLSPCAELEMSPRNIVKGAKKCGLDVIGICDHNSCENVPYIEKSVLDKSLNIIGGMEITSMEEVHMLALFSTSDDLFAMQKIVYDHLFGTNDEKLYGDQVVVNENDEVVGFNKKLLIGATDLSLEEIVNKVHDLNGVAIAAHIDRESFSVISQLGFLPEGLNIDALEVSSKDKINDFKNLTLPLVTFSDAHILDNIGRAFTNFSMKEATLDEMKKSFLGEDGRKVFI